MGYKTVYKDVMREFERNRDAAGKLLEKRKSEVYEKIPRVKEIETTMMMTGISLTREILSTAGDSAKVLTKLKRKNNSLISEKNELIKKHGFPPDYFINIYKCSICRDTGYVEDKKCKCLKQKMLDKYYDLSNLGEILKYENFDYFDLRYYSEDVNPDAGLSPKANIQIIYMTCMDFINNFDTEFSNLLFYGDTGLGKTFLLNCVAKEVLDMSKTVLYVTAPQIFKVFEDYRFNRDDMEEPDDYIDAVNSVDLLIIDDLGTEFSTVVTSSELFNIINTRLIEKRHTVISTNLTPTDFENQYSERITSRFFGNYKMLKFIGEDIRMLKKYRGLGVQQAAL